jgi:acyl-CoA thioesterase FadM
MLYVSANVAAARGARVRFAQDVRRDGPEGAVVCEGTAEVACMDTRGKPRRLPLALMSELTQ